MSIQIFGLSVSRGVAIGRAVRLGAGRLEVEHAFVTEADVPGELLRLRVARDEISAEITALRDDLPPDAPAELGALLEVHQMLLHDQVLIEAVKVWVRERHYNAEWALASQLDVLTQQFDEMDDPYLRERKMDLEQVVDRLVRRVRAGREVPPGAAPAPVDPVAAVQGAEPGEELILVAHDIGPADMMHFRRSVFRGFVTDVGGKTSHTAIVARSMDIPAVVGATEASALIRSDDLLVIDGDAGVVIVDPSPIVLEEYRYRQQHSRLDRDRLLRLRGTAAQTLDGVDISLHANIELPGDAATALAAGAAGIGLFRSEFLFMQRAGSLPGEEEQFQAYRSVCEAMGERPVTIRTIDIGADKPLERGSTDSRADRGLNPAMGLRAIRWSLAEPTMFLTQLRALLRASAHGRLRILVPMLMHVREALQVRQYLTQAQNELRAAGIPFDEAVPLGIMVEVPAAAIALDVLLPHADFVSIGTNDLIQYTLAVDRADEQVSDLYDPWHPAVLHLLQRTIALTHRAGKTASICGELAGDPQLTDLLLAMGLRQFSMHPSRLLPIKQQILRADCGKLEQALPDILSSSDPQATAQSLWRGATPLH
ncbi:phosphoenolpyruvate--protein phosphotransferase [Amphibiibacter pelophylacis]|uniref:Phosphoenolpyruvate--protein phosphotransferase n=1 Tax=Amphibiibacter pelophylacis TaxID=1799477 RepID=A0ACC6P1U1_9BURK